MCRGRAKEGLCISLTCVVVYVCGGAAAGGALSQDDYLALSVCGLSVVSPSCLSSWSLFQFISPCGLFLLSHSLSSVVSSSIFVPNPALIPSAAVGATKPTVNTKMFLVLQCVVRLKSHPFPV